MAADRITTFCAAACMVTSMESDDSEQGFSGRLDNFPLLDVVQMACVAQREGRLLIQHRDEHAQIVFSNGQIIHAETANCRGEEALLHILCWRTGEFIFESRSFGKGSVRTIYGGWEHVLMEAVRLRDEMMHSFPAQDRLPGLRSELTQSISLKLSTYRRRAAVVRWAWRVLILSAATGIFTLLAMHRSQFATDFEQIHHQVWDRFSNRLQWNQIAPAQIRIPGGTFVYQDGRTVSVAAFEIDSMETPVWQYTEFLKAVGDRTDFDHPNQPREKGHTNAQWSTYAKAAFDLSEYQGVPVNPNFPAVFLDWFDAYAYAKWRGRELPTEQEWEKAARGTDGRIYPWGDLSVKGWANLLESADHPAGWREIGSFKNDKSPYGVLDMAGNVSEWTESLDEMGNPIVRGGNFRNSDGRTIRRVTGISGHTQDERIGFRTIHRFPQ
jgi:hypothetical protein